MHRMMVTTGLLLITGVAAVLCYYRRGDDGMQSSPQGRRQVSVVLLGPASTITGIDVPPGLAQRNAEYRTRLRANEPSDVTVELPDGTRKRLPVQYVSINVNAGTVVDINLLPLPKSVPFKQAVAELHRLLEVLKTEPDERMREQLAGWPNDAPGFDPVQRPGFYPHKYRAAVGCTDDVRLFVELRAADDGGWVLALTLEGTGPKRRAVLEKWVAFRSSTRPGSQPSTQAGE